MARKETISREDILNAAFNMMKELGISEVTARKLAAYAGCSTQPIFRHFENMEDCLSEVFMKSLEFFDDFYLNYGGTSRVPFVNLGMAYIAFAEKNPNVFSFLFMTVNNKGMNLYNLLNGRTNSVMAEMNKAKEQGCRNPEMTFMKMWMLIHGAACMTITKDYDLSAADTRIQLEESYKAFTR